MLIVPADEEDRIREQHWNVQPGDVVIDVGSFRGTYTIPALTAGAIVHAVDARASTLADLRAFAVEHALADRLTPVHAALYDGGRYPAALLADIASGVYASSRDMLPDADVLWTTLDKFTLDRVDWVKIDVEGGEFGVLRGGKGLLRKRRPRLLIEDHSRVYPWVAAQSSTSRILALLHELGYDSQLVVDSFVDYIIATP